MGGSEPIISTSWIGLRIVGIAGDGVADDGSDDGAEERADARQEHVQRGADPDTERIGQRAADRAGELAADRAELAFGMHKLVRQQGADRGGNVDLGGVQRDVPVDDGREHVEALLREPDSSTLPRYPPTAALNICAPTPLRPIEVAISAVRNDEAAPRPAPARLTPLAEEDVADVDLGQIDCIRTVYQRLHELLANKTRHRPRGQRDEGIAVLADDRPPDRRAEYLADRAVVDGVRRGPHLVLAVQLDLDVGDLACGIIPVTRCSQRRVLVVS